MNQDKLNKPITINDFKKSNKISNKISIVTAYDYTSATIIENTDIMAILVGDSGAMVMAGHKNTINASTQMIAGYTASVTRGAKSKFIIADMPFLSFRKGINTAMESVEHLMKSGANAVKLEGLDGHEDVIKHIVKSDIPVMGHIGLTPQSINKIGGYKIQGKNNEQASNLITQAKILEQLGCFSIVVECVPSIIAKEITDSLSIPTIGIGAGPYTDGQVLVWHDLLGLTDYSDRFVKPRFVKEYLNGRELITNSLNALHNEINSNQFPDEQHSY